LAVKIIWLRLNFQKDLKRKWYIHHFIAILIE